MYRPYLKIWDWGWIFAVKAISSLGRSPCFIVCTWDIELCAQGKVAILHFYTKPFFFYFFFVLFLQPYSANWGILLSLGVFYFLCFYVSRLIVFCFIPTYLLSLLLPWPMYKINGVNLIKNYQVCNWVKVLDSDSKRIRQKFYQFFINEKFKKILNFFTCI